MMERIQALLGRLIVNGSVSVIDLNEAQRLLIEIKRGDNYAIGSEKAA
jgi:hypothetical protein